MNKYKIYIHTSHPKGAMNDMQTYESSKIMDIYRHTAENVSGLRIPHTMKFKKEVWRDPKTRERPRQTFFHQY